MVFQYYLLPQHDIVINGHKNQPVAWQLEPTEGVLSFFKSVNVGSNNALTLHLNVILGSTVLISTQSTDQSLNRKYPLFIFFRLTLQLPV